MNDPEPMFTNQPSLLSPNITPTLSNTLTGSKTPEPTISADLIITIPSGNQPTLDGTISSGEWNNAIQELFSDGSELLMMHHEGYLYLGIRANTPGMIAGNIFVDQGDQVSILH